MLSQVGFRYVCAYWCSLLTHFKRPKIWVLSDYKRGYVTSRRRKRNWQTSQYRVKITNILKAQNISSLINPSILFFIFLQNFPEYLLCAVHCHGPWSCVDESDVLFVFQETQSCWLRCWWGSRYRQWQFNDAHLSWTGGASPAQGDRMRREPWDFQKVQ